MPKVDELLLERARAMRSEMPQPERELWIALRGKRLGGVKFARQFIVGSYIADFCARSHKLIVEIDGHTHTNEARDAQRTAWLEQQGYRVIRFSNGDVMSNIEGVLQMIFNAIHSSPLPTSVGSDMPPICPEKRGALFTRRSPEGRGLLQ